MARIRTVKPEFWQDEDLAAVSESSLLLAVGLLNHADDEGYFKAHPGLIKAAVFPLREPSLSIHGMFSELSNAGYLELFEGTDGKQYGLVRNFSKHQRINRPSPSKIASLRQITEDSVNDHGGLTPGRERNREQGKEQCPAEEPPDVSFDDFWKSWPTDLSEKGNRKRAKSQWDRLRPDQQLATEIQIKLCAQAEQKRALRSRGEFAPSFQHAERWLRDRGWESEIPEYNEPGCGEHIV
ncbi:hypothetical protein [Parahaliea aestuarii]|uniref:Uncharacterized protein n=1 Tax=Parahaliea aestuarii TaxID=1852021 RepID=A0A5C9A514_9GAMM|nr:hypothetical protein [Parahaliea aestuarii]TXS95114.1 hypothetical protein FVW59_04245 [Parahaliea aestuarii]